VTSARKGGVEKERIFGSDGEQKERFKEKIQDADKTRICMFTIEKSGSKPRVRVAGQNKKRVRGDPFEDHPAHVGLDPNAKREKRSTS